MEYILASNNKGKIKEIKAILNIDIKTMEELGCHDEIEEFGLSFEQNALIKAQHLAKKFPNAIIISDDSGLEVRALDYAPGIYSKRFSGEDTNIDVANNKLLLSKMEDVTDRFARFRTVLCVYSQKYDLCNFYNGIIEGEIGTKTSGDNGFGYDPIFIYNGESFGSLPASEKNAISHRGRALTKLLASGDLNV